ncbi:GDCCVxC domain-containing (seleno)protein [Paraburkholderia phytofirmans]|uniref:GDCCVxC domain-containing (seleno)protein n=1 Tax=Paraburkholderia TaxID=1822464 RepID=UPI0009EF06F7|nr:GDCCVxC domain-containing (seleno)protein [Paraburkholderia phytofirmans]
MISVVLDSIITCPVCGHRKAETMPTNACVWFYECEHCKAVLRPKPGDCCVYCSYGTNRCPPMQQSGSCCVD